MTVKFVKGVWVGNFYYGTDTVATFDNETEKSLIAGGYAQAVGGSFTVPDAGRAMDKPPVDKMVGGPNPKRGTPRTKSAKSK